MCKRKGEQTKIRMQVTREAPAGKTTTQGFENNQKKRLSSQLAGFSLKSTEGKLRSIHLQSPSQTHISCT